MHHRTRITLATAAAAVLTGGLLTLIADPASAAGPAKAYDFNGDGYRDAVIGAPNGTANGYKTAGSLIVIPGSKTGLRTADRRIVSQSTGSVPDASETGDRFGAHWASADLNVDGYADLAVAAPGEAGSDGIRTGRITILWGSASGLLTGTQLPAPTAASQIKGVGAGGVFAVDVNGDGVMDLVSLNHAGDGDRQTVTVTPGPFKSGSTPKVAKEVYRGDLYEPDGTMGDFDGDGAADLVLHVIGYLRGTPSGLAAEPSWAATGIEGSHFTSGDFDHDGYADIAFGAANDGTGPVGGVVRVVYGGPDGPSRSADLSQASPGVPGTDENGDSFGAFLSTADVNGDGYADLAVGVPGEDIGSVKDTGSVTVLYGSANGITGKGISLDQGTAGVPGSNESGDAFGRAVWLRDINGDGKADLFVSATGEDKGAGRFWTLRGTASGITTSGAIAFDTASLKVPSSSVGQYFGYWLGG